MAVKYLPSWMPFQKFASRGRKMIEQFINKPFEQVMREMVWLVEFVPDAVGR